MCRAGTGKATPELDQRFIGIATVESENAGVAVCTLLIFRLVLFPACHRAA